MGMLKSIRTNLPRILAAAPVLLLTAAASAQADIVRPPKAEDPQEVSFILVMLVIVACVGVTIGLNVLPSRRTHQD